MVRASARSTALVMLRPEGPHQPILFFAFRLHVLAFLALVRRARFSFRKVPVVSGRVALFVAGADHERGDAHVHRRHKDE